jgi:16S rRNA (cytidine1402-2'-O)-methyltransferase
MPGTLHVISTPIGNLEDITLRALRLLREVALIAAEDTRRTAKLLHHYGISTPVLSYHEHNCRSRLPGLMRKLQEGQDLALVTDAGTPGMSDPGVELVDACITGRIPVNPVPGPSALLTAAVASGFPLTPLTWLGFGPHRSKDRIRWLEEIRAIPHTVCFLESPHRIALTIKELADVLADRPIAVARELTKAHQQVVRGTAKDAFGQLHSLKGEFTIIVGPAARHNETRPSSTDEEILSDLGRLEETCGFQTRRALASELAKRHGRSSREIYALILEQRPRSD